MHPLDGYIRVTARLIYGGYLLEIGCVEPGILGIHHANPLAVLEKKIDRKGERGKQIHRKVFERTRKLTTYTYGKEIDMLAYELGWANVAAFELYLKSLFDCSGLKFQIGPTRF